MTPAHHPTARLRVLAVDDVRPALEEFARLLDASPDVAETATADDPIGALKQIQAGRFDAVFLDISMPGLDGLELGSLLSRLSEPPAIVFVTAHERHAVTAYGIGAVDYLLKPVRAERLAAALDKVSRAVRSAPEAAPPGRAPRPDPDPLPVLPVETAGRTRYVRRTEVFYAEANGDYVRLHTRGGAHLVRMPLSRLEEYWAPCGFSRVHRGFLVALDAVRELHSDTAGQLLARTEVGDVPVSRRHARELRERLLQAARGGPVGSA
ncbi:LytR/AlgR family response regulator transcription factor [Nocardiopsis suaedae]|uniref:LytTR family DNA-binding domain-containing protein n=1 Tax=Nocardiopsis suaedae TaxID=3018444 RepID=A0ABT4TNZ6_9ACTN|nr:LytTR family DNA-binding domain-containing protein [Nocardiopsis suaedae]MDA2806396.1 LytTR family DNA-binding domain-containing protein [Nocardiopsis suaedae]